MVEAETERLLLRNWKHSDFEDLFEFAKLESVAPHVAWNTHKAEQDSKNAISKFIKDDDVLAIELKKENKVIGSIALYRKKPDPNNQSDSQREIYYALNPKYWGKGYMPEAVSGLLDSCFNEQGLDLIWCGYYDGNEKSKKVIEKSGFKYAFNCMELNPAIGKEVITHYYNITKEKYIGQT